jgi:uncharacterized protein YerC
MAAFEEPKQVRFFLERLLTESEIVMLARRLQIAELLVGGRTYEQIRRKLNVGMSTVQNVDRWLTDAAHEYRLIRDEQRQAERTRKRRERVKKGRPGTMPGTLQHLIRHDNRFILFRLLLGDF